LDRAIADYTQAIELDPDNADAYSEGGATEQKQNTQEKAHTIHDLAQAIATAREYVNAAEPLRYFHKQRAIVMCAAFGVKLAARHIEMRWERGSEYDNREHRYMIWVVNSFIDLVNHAYPPFYGLLEAPMTVCKFLARHNKDINEVVYQLRSLYLDALTDALSQAYHIDPNRTVSDDDLRQHGWDPTQPWPDPDDFW